MTEFLCRLRPARPEMVGALTDAESAAVSAHFTHLQEMVKRGVVRLAGRTTDPASDTFGIVVFRAASPEAAQAFVAADPAVAAGVMTAELFPFRTALIESEAR